jgi:UDP-2,3-diacylglucosamine pyrophosphatase LpxH
MIKFTKIIQSAFFPLCILAIIFTFGFITWALSGHGTIGLFRVTPISLYVFLFIMALGLIFTGLFFLYWWNRIKGRQKNRLFSFLFITSIIFIALFSVCFVQLGGFPPNKDIKPVTQLAIPDVERQDIHFAVGSDAHFGAGTNSPDKTIEMLKHIGDPVNKYDLFFSLGDLVEYGFKDSQWQEALAAFSVIANDVPMRFIPGNHDTLFGGLKRYLDYCGPTNSSQDASGLWQRIDVGKVHFLLLDVEWSAETITKGQTEWLEAQLKSIPAGDWKIVMSHGFYYSSGINLSGWHWYDNQETISALTPLFEKYGVDIVFSGHNHYMELLRHSSVTYVICGAFGGMPDPAPAYNSPASIWQLTGQTGYLDVDIHDNEAILNFRDYDSNILESYTVQK